MSLLKLINLWPPFSVGGEEVPPEVPGASFALGWSQPHYALSSDAPHYAVPEE